MKISPAAEMKEIDRQAIHEYGLTELALMENAGRQVAEAVRELLGSTLGKDICVLAGSGNNGGDALVAARHLANDGARVKIFLTGNPDHFSESMLAQYEILKNMGVELNLMKDGDRSLDKLKVVLRRFTDAVIDGICGTGFKGELRETLKQTVQAINESGKPVVAVDLPSGVNADNGEADVAVKAQVTVTFGLPKPGHFLCPGAALSGRLLVDDIGIPAKILNDGIPQTLLDDSLASMLVPPRPLDAHKGTCGRVLIVAGSLGMSGAAVLSSLAALKIGAGVVTLATAAGVQPVCAAKLTEVMVRPISEVEPGVMGGDRALADLLELMENNDALLMGPGIGRHPDTLEMVRRLVSYVDKPTVLDADAIFAFRKKGKLLASLPQIPILTPHLGEMAALIDTTVPELRKNILPILREKAKEFHAILTVKSECTLIAYPDGEIFFSSKGNPGMATAGSGDVLAGTIAGLAKQTENTLAPMAGVYLHGLAGDMAYEKLGDGLIASDILSHLPYALQKMRRP